MAQAAAPRGKPFGLFSRGKRYTGALQRKGPDGGVIAHQSREKKGMESMADLQIPNQKGDRARERRGKQANAAVFRRTPLPGKERSKNRVRKH